MELYFYKITSRSCNKLLTRFYNNKYVLANFLLHINSAHPSKIGKFYSFYLKSTISIYLIIVKKILTSIFYPLYKIPNKAKSHNNKFTTQKKQLVLTHLIKKNSESKTPDFYFGDLLSTENKIKYSILECQINHVGKVNINYKKINPNTIILSPRLCLFDEYKIICIQLYIITALFKNFIKK